MPNKIKKNPRPPPFHSRESLRCWGWSIRERFLHILTPITIAALLLTLVLLFSFKGEVIISNPLTILWIAVPLFIQTLFIFR